MSDSNPTLDVIRAAMALAERDVGLGLVTVEQIQAIPRTRFAAVERKQVAALLKAEGKSNREIAKVVGADEKTIRNDLRAENSAESADNSADYQSPWEAHDQELSDDDDQTVWRRGLLFRAQSAAAAATFEDWSRFHIDQQAVDAARTAADAWSRLARYLEEAINGKGNAA